MHNHLDGVLGFWGFGVLGDTKAGSWAFCVVVGDSKAGSWAFCVVVGNLRPVVGRSV
jgi:hypothetical protein